MPDITQVYLIAGFLGSGKTTLLNRIIKAFPKNRKLTILVNEFGEVGVDGALLENKDYDVMEISKGSIFCVCVKTDFIKGLYELSARVQSDVLIIESTGVANPVNLKKDLALPIFNGQFSLKEQFCIIDAAHFLDAYEVYASLEKQIASSTVFILNKIDLTSPDRIAETKSVVRRFHQDPLFFETVFADIPLGRFFDFDALKTVFLQNPEALRPAKTFSPQELDEHIDGLLDSPDFEMTPPDLLASVASRWTGTEPEEIEQMANALPASLVRAKGFIQKGGIQWLFNYVMGDWTFAEWRSSPDRITHPNVIVFIGPPESIQTVESLLQGRNWVADLQG